MADMVFRMTADANADVVKTGDLCGEPITWTPDPPDLSDPIVAALYIPVPRSGVCTFALGHQGDHTRP
jgi:hypothetical protein